MEQRFLRLSTLFKKVKNNPTLKPKSEDNKKASKTLNLKLM